MTNITINSLPTASTIDGSADILPIYTASALATQGINRNTLLGITSGPVGLTDSQTLTNKVLGNTNTLTAKDSLLTLQNASDTSKQARLSLASITTATTRTYTLPDVTDTLVSLTAAQTLTNKTLTSPTVTTPTITNATISADTLNGFSSATNGSVYGMSVAAGVLASAALLNTVNTAALQTNAVGAANIATNAITLGYAQITTNFTTASTTFVQATGLTITVTIPAGGRKVKISAFTNLLTSSGGAAGVSMSIWDGVVASGTQLAEWDMTNAAAAQGSGAYCVSVVTPSAGSKTYNVGLKTSANTGQLSAGATTPAFILVEAI